MEPRLKNSTQWSPFPQELTEQMAEALMDRFAEEYDLENGQFVVDGRIYKNEIVGLYGLRLDGQLKQHNFEISLEFDPEKQKALELIQQSMDVVEHLWTELLEDDLEDADLPRKWQTMPHNKVMYHFRYSTVNTDLEEQADRLLEEFEKKLVYQTEDHSDFADLPDQGEDTTDENTLH